MKKVVITIAAIVFAAVAVKAQSPSCEVRGMDACFGGAFSSRSSVSTPKKSTAPSAKKSNLERKVTQKVARAQAAASTQKQAQKTAKQTAKNTAKPAAKPANKSGKKAPKTGAVPENNACQWLAATWSAPYSGRPIGRYWIDLAK